MSPNWCHLCPVCILLALLHPQWCAKTMMPQQKRHMSLIAHHVVINVLQLILPDHQSASCNLFYPVHLVLWIPMNWLYQIWCVEEMSSPAIYRILLTRLSLISTTLGRALFLQSACHIGWRKHYKSDGKQWPRTGWYLWIPWRGKNPTKIIYFSSALYLPHIDQKLTGCGDCKSWMCLKKDLMRSAQEAGHTIVANGGGHRHSLLCSNSYMFTIISVCCQR